MEIGRIAGTDMILQIPRIDIFAFMRLHFAFGNEFLEFVYYSYQLQIIFVSFNM